MEKGDVWAMLGLINIVVGVSLIIAPVLAIKTGYILSLIISVFITLFCYYTAWLLIVHQNRSLTIAQMIQNHFTNHACIWLKMYESSLAI